MKSVEESVVTALDGNSIELFPFLPYILQDLWEIGSSPDTIINLIKKNCTNYNQLEILDIGCGKGAVSINIAKTLSSKCYGIDAVGEFIEFCNAKAIELNLADLCQFKTADCRIDCYFDKQFDVIILGSVGPIFGDYASTFKHILPFMKSDSILILDDGYLDDNDTSTHHLAIKKIELIKHSSNSGLYLLDEVPSLLEGLKEQNEYILNSLITRCKELMNIYSTKKDIFQNYIDMQIEETNAIETYIKCSTIVFKKIS